jgi:hypothetical protein
MAKPSKPSTRPLCVHCGNKYGSRKTTDERIEWDEGTQPPRYTGNLLHLRDRWPHSIVVKDPGPRDGVATRKMTATRELWDGISYYVPYYPFCTLRCALGYARKAYQKEYEHVAPKHKAPNHS